MPLDNTKEPEDLWLSEESGKLEDEYLLGDIIGRGSFSTIYKCLRKGRTEWTCKVLEKRRLNRNLVKSVLPRLMKLKHPNIIKIKEVFETETTIQLIAEYVSGGEIFEKIVEKGQYSEEDAAAAVRDILHALKYLHSEGVVHGDIKPENLLYETEMDDSRLKMADFGLSHLFLDKDLMVNNITGTVRFCAPEVLMGNESDSSADLWSLGVVMYIMLSGFEPFLDEDGDAATCQNIVQGQFSFSSPIWDDISDSAKDLIAKLLSVDPKDRPTAEEALEHEWTRGLTTSSVQRNSMIKGLREYNARRRFRVATKAVLATRRAFHLVQNHRDGAGNKCGAFGTTNGFHGTEQLKEFARWFPVDGGNGDGRASEHKPLSLTTRSTADVSSSSSKPESTENLGGVHLNRRKPPMPRKFKADTETTKVSLDSLRKSSPTERLRP